MSRAAADVEYLLRAVEIGSLEHGVEIGAAPVDEAGGVVRRNRAELFPYRLLDVHGGPPLPSVAYS